MRRIILLSLILQSFMFFAIAGIRFEYGVATQVQMEPKHHGGNHTEVNPPADMPDVYYNSELDVITIVDYANATYYVTIYDDWWNVVITDTKPGGGTIDVSSLSSGDYVIEISTSWNHDYEGQFTVP